MFNTTTFGPDGQVVEQTIDHGDGTGTRTHYAPDGTITSTEPVTDLPIPVPDQEARIADLETKLDAALALIAGE